MKCKNTEQMNRLCENIMIKGFFTGSRAIGGYTDKSDYDFVMMVDSAKQVYDELGIEFKLNDLYEYALLFSSYKYTYNNKVINLILVDGIADMMAWQYATMEMIEQCEWPDAKDRKAMFGHFLLEYYQYNCKDDEKVALAINLWDSNYFDLVKRISRDIV